MNRKKLSQSNIHPMYNGFLNFIKNAMTNNDLQKKQISRKQWFLPFFSFCLFLHLLKAMLK
jgi:hypothetical protein